MSPVTNQRPSRGTAGADVPPAELPPILAGGLPRALHHGPHRFTAVELLDSAHAAAVELRSSGAVGGSRIAVEGDGTAPSRLAHLLGADLLGAGALLLDPGWSPAERSAVLEDAAPDVRACGRPGPPGTRFTARGSGRSLFHFPTTSGSTSRPKVLARTRSSWWCSFAAFEVGITAEDAVLIPGPLSSSLFLFGALHAMHLGAEVELLERWSAEEAAEACSRADVVHLVPSMLAALLAVLERDPRARARCRVRRFVCGGAEPDARLRERLAETLPGCELVEYYGSAEHSLVALRRADGLLHPARHVETEIRDGAHAVAPGGTGTLWVRSPLGFSGRMESGELTPVEPGFHSVGDLASAHVGGGFTVLGRDSATIGSGAELVPAERVEGVLRSVPGVVDAVVVGTPHPRLGSLVTAVLEVDPSTPPPVTELRRVARESLSSAQRPRRWLSARALPRTPAGKPARRRIEDQLGSGELPTWTLR
ncbi:AMP-binding protein [Actinopolyspora saharensis]|uniref:Acyl-CoA synthetase (AMP-forming)/AMP-acid ligase II n=1 Tax=Actinopolyspora saharensis TaxID=995062 RepID=A0A1H1H6L8_9ACTN|nr:AMP-binding protein [Actinopolyspora saharensis]SDR21013.1 Acyl-CoA synthetase (AMP-forming)/AMP-acid ligase II [Actinopolyspora saharensis]